MKSSPAVPGKLCTMSTGGRVFLILSVHLPGQSQQCLQGFTGSTPANQATLAETDSGDWKVLGKPIHVPLAKFAGPNPAYQLVARRGPPITFMPGATESAADRLQRSKANLRDAGGARRSFNLTEPALKALSKIRTTRQQATDEKLDDTKVVNSLLLEEAGRLARKGK